MELTEEAKAEIREAVRILREDGLHIHKSYAAFLKSQGEDKPEDKTDPKSDDNPEDNPTEGEPPPSKDKPTEKPKRKSLWWGENE